MNQRPTIREQMDACRPDSDDLHLPEHAADLAELQASLREGGEVLQTIELDRGCFACTLGGADNRTLFMVVAEWGGAASMAGGQRTGQVLTVEAPAPRAGWP